MVIGLIRCTMRMLLYTQAAEPLAPWLDALREVFAYEFQYDYRQKSAVFAWRAQLWAALAGMKLIVPGGRDLCGLS